MIDHTGHPHPSTPKARALCRANGGTGFIGKFGENAPVEKKGHVPELTRPKVPVVAKPVGNVEKKTPVAKPVGKVPVVKDAPKIPIIPPPAPDAKKPADAKQLGNYIPTTLTSAGKTTADKERNKIQNALRIGASRDFIVSRSKLTPDQANREIDNILIQYGVPNHVYPRVGTGGPAPDIKTVKPAKPASVAKKAADLGKVPVPSDGPSPELTTALANNKADFLVKSNVDNVLRVQEALVGSKIARVKSVDSKLPRHDSPQGKKWKIHSGTLAVCTGDGHVHLHEGLHAREAIINKAAQSGWFTPGGSDPIENVVAHELGHALLMDHRMTPSQRRKLIESVMMEFSLDNPLGAASAGGWYNGLMNRVISHPPNNAKIKRSISKYAATSMDELIAEVWTEYTMNKKPRPRVKRIGDVIKGIIQEGKF